MFDNLLCLCMYVRCRINRNQWNLSQSIENKVDAHVFSDAYKRSQWDSLTPLLVALYGNSSENFAWSLCYYEKFNKVFNEVLDDVLAK